MNNKLKILSYLALVLIIFSCRKDFEYKNLSTDKKVTVSCFIKADDTVKVSLSFLVSSSTNYNITSDEALLLTNAEVYLYEDNIYKEKLKYKNLEFFNNLAWYKSQNFIPTEGHNYELKIVVPSYDTIYAETVIPKKIFIDSIRINNSYIDECGTKMLNISVLFKDNPYETNYYLIRVRSDLGPYIFESQDPIIEAKINNVFSSIAPNINERNAYFSDKNINGENYALNIIIPFYSDFPPKIYLYSLSKDAYLFYKTAFLYARTLDNPLSEPVVIYSNIKNGTGIFAGMSSDVDSIILIKNQIK